MPISAAITDVTAKRYMKTFMRVLYYLGSVAAMGSFVAHPFRLVWGRRRKRQIGGFGVESGMTAVGLRRRTEAT